MNLFDDRPTSTDPNDRRLCGRYSGGGGPTGKTCDDCEHLRTSPHATYHKLVYCMLPTRAHPRGRNAKALRTDPACPQFAQYKFPDTIFETGVYCLWPRVDKHVYDPAQCIECKDVYAVPFGPYEEPICELCREAEVAETIDKLYVRNWPSSLRQ